MPSRAFPSDRGGGKIIFIISKGEGGGKGPKSTQKLLKVNLKPEKDTPHTILKKEGEGAIALGLICIMGPLKREKSGLSPQGF